PHFGWRVMFALGGLPLILAIIIRRSCPESPRWLASKGLLAEADAVVQAFEREAPLDKALQQPSLDESGSGLHPRDPKPKGSPMDIFSYRYLVRTLSTCMLWICAYICSYAIALWLPTLFTQVYGLSLQSALNFSIVTSAAGALGCGMLSIYVDRIKRPTLLWVGFATTASALLALTLYPVASVGLVIVCCTIAMFFLFLLAGALYLYTPELYPTSSRAAGTGFASIWARIAAMGTPFVMGFLIQQGAARTIFMTLAIVALVGATVSKMWAVDRTGQSLEA
ncbi:MAG TPA: MFS transporter, partial [Candidatus Sulfotelmatobacter sp.]|nr:MFS transporter [Candidatus Sulfotelmatobacter sp.]